MNNRKIIEKFCKEYGFKILRLDFVRDTQACYGDTWREDYWEIEVERDGIKDDFLTVREDGTLTEDIYKMFDEILDDYNEPKKEHCSVDYCKSCKHFMEKTIDSKQLYLCKKMYDSDNFPAFGMVKDGYDKSYPFNNSRCYRRL